MVPSVVERTHEDTHEPDHDTHHTCRRIRREHDGIAATHKSDCGERRWETDGIPVVYRESHDPLRISIPRDMFFLEFFERKMRIQDKPEKIPIDEEEKRESQDEKFVGKTHEMWESEKDDMVQKENHEYEHAMVAGEISEKSDWCLGEFAPSREIFGPTVLSLYLDLEEREKDTKEENIESKHSRIIPKSLPFSKLILYLLGVYVLKEHFLEFFHSLCDALQDQFWYDDTAFYDIVIRTPEPAGIDDLDTFCRRENIFRMDKPLSPVFWIIARPCIGYFAGLDIEYEDDRAEKVDLQERFSWWVHDFLLGKRGSGDKFLDDIGGIFSLILHGERFPIGHIFTREEIVKNRHETLEMCGYLDMKALLYDIMKDT